MDGLVRINPCKKARADILSRRKSSKKSRRKKGLTLEQHRAFINFVCSKEEFLKWKNIFIVLLRTGLRVGEFTALTEEDCFFSEDRSYLLITSNLIYKPDLNRKCYNRIETPKTANGYRKVPMFDEVKEALLDEMSRRENRGIFYSVDGKTNWIFINRNNIPYKAQNINRAIKRIVDKYNREETIKAMQENRKAMLLPNFSVHILRHTACSRLAERGMAPKVLQEIIGHSDIETTLDYYADIDKIFKHKSVSELHGKMFIH